MRLLSLALAVITSLTALTFHTRASAQPSNAISLSTWNLEWLNADLDTGVVKRSQADYDRLAVYALELNSDVVSFQEVDGSEAAARVFDPDEYDFFFEAGNSVQRTGFAVRRSLLVIDEPNLEALNTTGGLRAGTVITVMVDGEPLRLMSVHLKSGCWGADLSSSSDACTKLRDQVPVLETWIDEQAEGDVPFIVLGDFNRRFDEPGDTFWPEIDDGDPENADLMRLTEGLTSECWDSEFPVYIDHIVFGRRSAEWLFEEEFEQMLYDPADTIHKSKLSDHCPQTVWLLPPSSDTEVTLTTGEREAMLNILDAIEADLDAIRALLEDD